MTNTVSGLQAGSTYFFAATAYNAGGLESDYSNEVAYTVPVVNDPPTISPLADQVVPEDTSTAPLPFTVGDVDNDPATLTLSATSSNPALLTAANVVFAGSGANRTVRLTPAANANGSTLVTLTVSDGAATATTSFTLTVTPVNDPPTLSPLADQVVPEDTPTAPLPFTIGDADNDPATLTLSATSSNPALLPAANVVFAGSGANRTVRLTPTANANGNTLVTLTVSDGTVTATTSFPLIVTPVNDPPTIGSLADQVVSEDTSTAPLPFTVGDADNDPATLTLSATSSNAALVPAKQIVVGGTGANRTVTVTPTTGQTGTTIITLTISDGPATASSSFVLSVAPDLPAPWTAQDIGTPNLPGHSSFAGTTYLVSGSGTDIGGTADQFQFAWQPLSDDGEIVARVTALSATDPWAKAGVMIRETLNVNSEYVFMGVTSGSGFACLRRTATGGSSTLVAGGNLNPAPDNWVRLVQKKGTLKAYLSANGKAWTQVGPALNLNLASQIYVGLAVTSRNYTTFCTATFDQVNVVP